MDDPHTAVNRSAEQQLSEFIDKFDPALATLIRECRGALRRLLPTAVELVYDNYNFFVIGYCATPRASDCIVSIAAAANGVGLSFYYGATLPDPHGRLQGKGTQNRFVRVPRVDVLSDPVLLALIAAAVAQARTALPVSGNGSLVIQSVSAKQRPRRKPQV